MTSAGKKFRQSLASEQPLQIVGTINAYSALMAQRAGFSAIYLSGAGVANMSYGLPDLGFTHLDDVLTDAKRITSISPLPLLVDIDTAWEDDEGIAHTIRSMISAGVAAVHLEDQVSMKRCGHRPNKQLVSLDHMVDRVRQAVSAKTDPDFFIIARTDALANEGLTSAIERAQAYVEAGADAIFAEAVTELDEYQTFSKALGVPILANITEFGKTPLFTLDALKSVGVSMVLYPLSAVRAMNQAALLVYRNIHDQGTQQASVDAMQDRETLYDILDYYRYEREVDAGKS